MLQAFCPHLILVESKKKKVNQRIGIGEYVSKWILLKVYFRHWKNGLPMYIPNMAMDTRPGNRLASHAILHHRQVSGKPACPSPATSYMATSSIPQHKCHVLRADATDAPGLQTELCHWLTQPPSPTFVTLTSLVIMGALCVLHGSWFRRSQLVWSTPLPWSYCSVWSLVHTQAPKSLLIKSVI